MTRSAPETTSAVVEIELVIDKGLEFEGNKEVEAVAEILALVEEIELAVVEVLTLVEAVELVLDEVVELALDEVVELVLDEVVELVVDDELELVVITSKSCP